MTDAHNQDLTARTGSNLYPATMRQSFGDLSLELDVPEGVWNPTPHGIHLGNMLMKLDFTNEHVLEIGTGCGIHAILLAKRGAREITITELHAETNANALHNLRKHGVEIPIHQQVADWIQIEGASHQGGPWDTLVTNPPTAKAGKHYRRYFHDTLILDAHKLVKPGGRLIFINSSMIDIPRTIALMEECAMTVRILGETSGPFRDYYFEDDQYMLEMARIPGAYQMIDGVHHERLVVFEARLPESAVP